MTHPHGTHDSATEAAVPERDVARNLVQSTFSYAIFLLDTDATVATWPAPARDLYGYEPAAVLGQHVSVLFADEESKAPRTISSLMRKRIPWRSNTGISRLMARFSGER